MSSSRPPNTPIGSPAKPKTRDHRPVHNINCDFTQAEIDRFKSRLRIDPDTGCHEWTGCRQKPGKRNQHNYGIAYIQGSQLNAHKLSKMMELRAHIPAGQWVLHRCDNPPCCNPQHLYVGTPRDNAHDMIARGRASFNRTQAGDSISDERVLEMAATGLCPAALRSRYGHCSDTIKAAFARLGLTPPRGWSPISDDRIREIASWGLPSYEEMGRRANHSPKNIRDRFVKLGLPAPEKGPAYNRIPDDRLREIAASGLPSFVQMEQVYGHCRKTLVAGFDRLDLPRPTQRGRPRIHPINPTQGA